MLNRGVKLDLVSIDPDKYAVDESVRASCVDTNICLWMVWKFADLLAAACVQITWWSFSSTTTNIAALENPMFLGKDGDRTIFQIMTRHGVDIGAFSVRSLTSRFSCRERTARIR